MVPKPAAEDDCATWHRQAVEIAIEPFVLSHDVAGGFEECAEGLGGGGLWNEVRHLLNSATDLAN